mgnify:CR=1 FL=1
MSLPNQNDLYARENIEFALLTLNNESWGNIIKETLINEQIELNSNDKFINEMEQALREGADFNDIIERFDKS